MHMDSRKGEPPEKKYLIFTYIIRILNIPQIVQTVKVNGQVHNPFSLSYEKERGVKYYIDKRGGFDSNAIKRKVYVQYANGSTASTKNFIVINTYPRVESGSQIIVPEKPFRENKMSTQELVGISSALTSMALVIVTIINTLTP